MNQNKIKKSNFTLILVATTLFVVVTSIIGIGFFRFYMNHFKETEDETRYQRYYALITEERKSSFWQSVYQPSERTAPFYLMVQERWYYDQSDHLRHERQLAHGWR